MADRLLVGILGNRNSGKSYTWNSLFGRTVRTGIWPRKLELRPHECVEVFLVSGSFEERGIYAGDILDNQDCRIVLCSLQYTESVQDTIDYLVHKQFSLYVQWLNPGHSDTSPYSDHLGVVDRILSAQSVFSVRDGTGDASARVREIKEFIYGWSKLRDLIVPT